MSAYHSASHLSKPKRSELRQRERQAEALASKELARLVSGSLESFSVPSKYEARQALKKLLGESMDSTREELREVQELSSSSFTGLRIKKLQDAIQNLEDEIARVKKVYENSSELLPMLTTKQDENHQKLEQIWAFENAGSKSTSGSHLANAPKVSSAKKDSRQVSELVKNLSTKLGISELEARELLGL